jgi:hypothetical protein
MLFLTVLLSVLFGVQFVTQFHGTLSRIASARKIYFGLLSNNDIVAISHKRYSKHHYIPRWDGTHESCRFYISSSGRLYKRIVNEGHTTVIYISRKWALLETRYTNDRHEVSYVVKPGNVNSVVQTQYIRPALATI